MTDPQPTHQVRLELGELEYQLLLTLGEGDLVKGLYVLFSFGFSHVQREAESGRGEVRH